MRDFQKLVDRGGECADAGTALQESTRELLRNWNELTRGNMTREAFDETVKVSRGRIEDGLGVGMLSSCMKTFRFCDQLLRDFESLFVFTRADAGVAATNNCSEQSLRKAVIFRKLSFGTSASTGSKVLRTMLSVSETLRRRGTDVYTRNHQKSSMPFEPVNGYLSRCLLSRPLNDLDVVVESDRR